MRGVGHPKLSHLKQKNCQCSPNYASTSTTYDNKSNSETTQDPELLRITTFVKYCTVVEMHPLQNCKLTSTHRLATLSRH